MKRGKYFTVQYVGTWFRSTGSSAEVVWEPSAVEVWSQSFRQASTTARVEGAAVRATRADQPLLVAPRLQHLAYEVLETGEFVLGIRIVICSSLYLPTVIIYACTGSWFVQSSLKQSVVGSTQ